MRRGHLAALLALAAAAACLPAPAAGRSLAGEPLLAATKPWDSKKAEYQKPLIGILAQVCWQAGTRNQLRTGLRCSRVPAGAPFHRAPCNGPASRLEARLQAQSKQPHGPSCLRSFPCQACHYCPGRSYVAAGFVKWIEAAGARAVPIR